MEPTQEPDEAPPLKTGGLNHLAGVIADQLSDVLESASEDIQGSMLELAELAAMAGASDADSMRRLKNTAQTILGRNRVRVNRNGSAVIDAVIGTIATLAATAGTDALIRLLDDAAARVGTE